MKNDNLKLKILRFFIVIFIFSFFIFHLGQVQAQTSLPLTVAPARQEILVEPGEKTAVTVKFLNDGDTPVSGLLKVVDFVVEDKEGTPTFVEGTPMITGLTQISPRFSAASWFTLPYDRMTIAPHGKVTFQAKIQVPADAHPGGRYVAIYFEPGGTTPEALGGQKEVTIPIAIRIASLVYLRVAGPIKEDAYVVRFTIPRFAEHGPLTATTEILNRGDYHIRPKGVIKVYNLFGKTVDQQSLVEQNIFPDASRVYENKIGSKWMFGKYKAELAAAYGESGKALTATVFFWVVPYKEISAGILALAIVVLAASLLVRRLRRREKELEEKIEELEKKLEEKS
ncbi:MAG: hypothetical protein ACPLXP_03495 [Microgenomates group bacterium]